MAKKKLQKKKTKKKSSRKRDVKKTALSASKEEEIVIDAENGLVFSSEKKLYDHFSGAIQILEKFFFDHRPADDIDEKNFSDYEECLPMLLETPLEIWRDTETVEGQEIINYLGEFEDEENQAETVFYVAQVYLTGDVPSFVYLHFPTHSEELVQKYRIGELIFDQYKMGQRPGSAEGDSLSDGDELAVGLYDAMKTVRSETDIEEEDFFEFVELREESIESADEIWRSNDLKGNVLVSFIREFPDIEVDGFEGQDLYYIVVTVEEDESQVHTLLFSFPTVDKTLVDRYRHGENLQAEEVVQQSNH